MCNLQGCGQHLLRPQNRRKHGLLSRLCLAHRGTNALRSRPSSDEEMHAGIHIAEPSTHPWHVLLQPPDQKAIPGDLLENFGMQEDGHESNTREGIIQSNRNAAKQLIVSTPEVVGETTAHGFRSCIV